MFIVVVMLFAVCWLPYHGYFVYQFIDHQVISYKYVQHIFLSFYWLAMSNAMINPLVYYYMNARYMTTTLSALYHVNSIGTNRVCPLPTGCSRDNDGTLCDCENQISPVLQDRHLSMFVPSPEIVVGVWRDWSSRCSHSSREHWRSPFKSRSITTTRLDTLLFLCTVYLSIYDVVESSLLDVHSAVYPIDSIVLIMDSLTSALSIFFFTRLSFYTWVHTFDGRMHTWYPSMETWSCIQKIILAHNRSMQNDLRVAGSIGRLFYDCYCFFFLIYLLFTYITGWCTKPSCQNIPSAIYFCSCPPFFWRDSLVIILTRTHTMLWALSTSALSTAIYAYVPIFNWK